MKVLVVNCGSSSIKYQLYQMPERTVLSKGMVERIGEENSALVHESGDQKTRVEQPIADHEESMALILSTLADEGSDVTEISAIGHRVVHGAEEFTGSMLVSDAVIDSLERYAHLAPLHNPPNLIGIRAAMSKLPGVPQVAVFDTAFHTTIPEVAYTYALPHDLCKKHGIRRYGFHGTSHRYVTQRTAQLMDIPENKINCITTHLGNGCSMAAVRNGQSVDTSMGLTPLEGLVMGTRTGDFDPAILFYLSDHGYDIDELKAICNKKSGMLGISGESNDMRTLSALAAEGNDRAQLAIDIFCYRVKKYIGMYMAVLGRVDSVVFTGGIGENNAAVRSSICSELDELGITIDVDLNAKTIRGGEGPITTADSRTSVLVVPTDEEAAIAADTYEIVGSGQ